MVINRHFHSSVREHIKLDAVSRLFDESCNLRMKKTRQRSSVDRQNAIADVKLVAKRRW